MEKVNGTMMVSAMVLERPGMAPQKIPKKVPNSIKRRFCHVRSSPRAREKEEASNIFQTSLAEDNAHRQFDTQKHLEYHIDKHRHAY